MADRFPLIYNPSAGQIQELASVDNLDLTSSGITGVTNISASGIVTAIDFNATSDINLKENINIIDNSIDKIIAISGVTFNWKESKETSAGVLAQDVEKVFPEIVKINENVKTINYNGLIGLMIEAIKEQQAQIENLKKEIDSQKTGT